MTTRAQRRIVGERGPEMILPLHRAPELLAKMGGGGGGGVSVSIGALAPGLLDLPKHVLARVIGDGVASSLQRRGSVRRQVRHVGSGGL